MIVRNVLKHPELIESFDWYNDGDDTIQWLMGVSMASIGREPDEAAIALAVKMRAKSREYFAQQAESRQ